MNQYIINDPSSYYAWPILVFQTWRDGFRGELWTDVTRPAHVVISVNREKLHRYTGGVGIAEVSCHNLQERLTQSTKSFKQTPIN